MLIPITDPDDPRVLEYRQIRDADRLGRTGRFMAEGEVVVERLSRATAFRTASLLLAEKRAAKLAPVIDRLPEATPVYLASQPVLDAVAGFHLHRGVLALAEPLDQPGPEAILGPDDAPGIVVVAVGLSNHDNLGGVFRNAAAFGARGVLVDATSCDPLYRKSIRVSVGTVLTLPFARVAAGTDLVELVRRHGYEPLALSPSAETALHRLVPPRRAALFIGAEGPGLEAALLARAKTVGIPMAEGVDSLNAAATSAVALHHLRFGGG